MRGEKFGAGGAGGGAGAGMSGEKFGAGGGQGAPAARLPSAKGDAVSKMRGKFEGGGAPTFDGEKFDVPGRPGADRYLQKDDWSGTPAMDSLQKTMDAWVQKYGKAAGLQDGWKRAFNVKVAPSDDPSKLRWHIQLDDGKAGGDLKKPGKLFWGKFQVFLDPSDGKWMVKKESFEVKDPPQKGGGSADDAALEKLKKERGFCVPPCTFVPNMFDPRFCRDCQKFKPE
eukprot:TRINITY_DN51176_c0_g1_i1.p2 TRINITY_DN51176_c0_g1~~TRINITY_DN51176_c0_g1_i1.p2  ORF type:complete len:255 (+),score=76.55 TRINITY_DN51176_c0_g1_i1:86-766(+)